MTGSRIQFFIFMLIGLWLPGVVSAELPLSSETFSLSGFGTLGGAYNLDGQAGFIRDISQPKGAHGNGFDWAIDSRMGLQAIWKPRDDFESTVQLVGKYNSDGNYRPQVTWAFLKYAVTPSLLVRAGRLGVDLYLQADSRDVGYAYLWVRPPVDYFGLLFTSYLDGVDLTITRELGERLFRGKLYAGQARESISSDGGVQYSLDGSMVAGGHIEYQHLNWLLRISYSDMRLENESAVTKPLLDALRSTGVPQAVALAQGMNFAGTHNRFFSVGAAYDDGPLQSQWSLNHIWTESLASHDSTAGYWSIGYRMGQWTPYLIYSRAKSNNKQYPTGLPNIPPLDIINAGVAQALASGRIDQETFSLGMRYDFSRNADFKLQLDWVDNHDHSSFMWRNPEPDWDGQATIISATLDFIF